MILLHLFEWLGRTPVGVFMQQSSYAFEAAEMFHLLALAALGGGVLIIDLRVLGLGLTSQSAVQLVRAFRLYLTASLCVSVATGLLLLSAEPLKCYYNLAFRIKMLCLVTAILFSALVQRRWLERRATAVASLVLWLGVGLAGRAVGLI